MSYIPNSLEVRRQMLDEIGVADFADLVKCISPDVLLDRPLNLPKALSEFELEKQLRELAAKNAVVTSNFAGAGAYDHFSPAAVDHILLRPEFYTAYTPYQAEVSQGTLQVIYEFQSFISRLTSMDVTNASMYDGATAMAEAVMMALTHTGRKDVLISQAANPNYVKVVRGYLAGQKARIRIIEQFEGITSISGLKNKLSDRAAAVVLQSPNFLGQIEKAAEYAEAAKSVGALFIMGYDPLSLGILAPPGECGADIAVAEGQSLGLPLNFGGPYLGLLSTKKEFIRRIPGRLAGRTKDKNGKPGFVLTLQTREQHIRRERATSNICTNQALCALAATVYMSLLGKIGLEKVGQLCLSKAHYAASKITTIPGYSLKFKGPFFKEFVVEGPAAAGTLITRLSRKGIVPGLDLGRFGLGLRGSLMVAVTEKRSKDEIDRLASELAAAA
ncbi:MAG: glycine dehydrogenase (aminomethyl-transferring) [candidate division Zixibacteria bacterium RBG_16_53_22]|nr:MAG: glycine dehydrogenase (aminomethyl-transferring) [candidate division Zixibacteria bacterium RBG_16_53_22]